MKGGLEVLQKRAIDLRCAAGIQPNLLTTIDLRSTNTRPRKYEAGSAYAIEYKRGSMPPDDVVTTDLHRMLSLLHRVEASGLRWDPEREPIGLVFRLFSTKRGR